MGAVPADVGAQPWPAGLTSDQALDGLARVGHNVLPESPRSPAWRRLLDQLGHFFALLLWGAAGMAALAGMPALAVAICAVVVVNALFAFLQENRAERAAAGLRDLLPVLATVIRDGREQQVTADLIVPGDLVLLAAGDRVSADLRCVQAEGAEVDTSTLTGESVPLPVGEGDLLHAGTFLVAGRIAGVVEATGGRTELGRITRLTGQRRPPTPLEREIDRLVRTIALVAGCVGAVFFALMLLLGVPATEGFVFALGVTVALVPEGLLPTVSLSLAIGAQRMATRNALVRRLESVETLGATTFICTDKTGTLTENRMNVVAIWTPAGTADVAGAGYSPEAQVVLSDPAAADDVRRAVRVALLASAPPETAGAAYVGDPMEVAMWVLAGRLGMSLPGGEPGEERIAHLPFDARRRMSVGLLPGAIACKGAPEAVLAVCDEIPRGVQDALAAMLDRGLRVLAVAEGPQDAVTDLRVGSGGAWPAGVVPAHLGLVGLLGYHDPPRPGVTEAIGECRRAGVRLAMITGDHPATARSIAAQIGLALPDSPVLVAAELPTDPHVLAATIDRDGVVLARATPEDKLRIAQALQLRGHVVAMTGDGVNDAPALKMADIGVAMGRSGTEVAREAADLVLLDDHFATIVAAVRQGRETFLNLRRFLTYHLTDNVAELAPFLLWAISGGRFPLALGVMQILALDLGTDTLPATALGAERSAPSVLDHPPIRGRLMDRAVAVRAFGLIGPAEAVLELVVFAVAMWSAGWRPGLALPDAATLASASGGAFLTVVVMQMANAFACRSTRRPAWRVPLVGNRFLPVAVGASLAFALTSLLVVPVAAILGHAWPPAVVLPLIALGAPLVLLIDAAWKSRVHRVRTAASARV